MNHRLLLFTGGGLVLILLLGGGLALADSPHNNSPDVAIGPSGTVFSYMETFGEMGVPYIGDNEHINYPEGAGVDSAGNVWVAETEGNRALKYSPDGEFMLSIGEAGSPVVDETHFCDPVEIAVDSGGNTWVTDRCSNRAVQYDAGGNYLGQLGVTWESGADNDHFADPIGIAFDSAGNIYVSDEFNHRVQVFYSSGTYSMTIGETGVPGSDNDHFRNPYRIAIDQDDQLYVADMENHRVQIFDASHTYTATLGTTGECLNDNDHLCYPRGVAVDADYIYVADGNPRVQVFDRLTRAYVTTLGGAWGPGDYELKWPLDVAVDAAGNVLVSDGENHRVQKYGFDGSTFTYVRTFGTTGVPYLDAGYHYNAPRLSLDAGQNLLISEELGHRLVKLDPNGDLLWSFGVAGAIGGEDDHLSRPRQAAADSSGTIYVPENWSCRLKIISSEGAFLDTFGTGCGTGDYEFNGPAGVAIDSADNLYVVDQNNQRVMIYNSAREYVNQIGEDGVCSADNDHLCWPEAVAVDSAGNIYVADRDNQRVQVFDSSLQWVMSLGSGTPGEQFDQLNWPDGVAVDAQGKIYVSEWNNNRVQVFDSSGAYLTTIGGAWGTGTNQFNGVSSVAVDLDGNVYIGDWNNYRAQKFAPGVPDWTQVNVNGFGDRFANGVTALEAFDGQLYAGASNWLNGGLVYRSTDEVTWEAISEPGFGYTSTVPAIIDLAVFDGQLYAGTGWGDHPAQAWRTADGTTWEEIISNGFDDLNNNVICTFIEFDGMLYAGVGNSTSGAQIWRSASGDAGDWAQVAPDLPGSENTTNVTGFAVYQGELYAAVEANNIVSSPAQVWRSSDGDVWEIMVADGFGDPGNISTGGFAEYGGYLYLGTLNDVTGAQLWRSDGTTWEQEVGDGFGDAENYKIEMLSVFAGELYAEVNNDGTGLKILRSSDGLTWEQVNPDGFGDNNNLKILWNSSTVEYKGRLHIGTWNWANGGEIWRYDLLAKQIVYLPAIQR